MNESLKRTNMMEEAKVQGKPRMPAAELLVFIVVYMVASYVQSFIFTIFAFVFCQSDPQIVAIMNSPQPDLQKFMERFLQLLSIAPEWLYILNIFLSLVFAFATVIFCRNIDKRSIASIGIRKANVIAEYFCGLVLGTAAISLVAGIGIFTKSFVFNGQNGISVPVFIFYILAFAVQGFAEELMLRGYYLTAITKKATPIYAIVSNGILSVLLFTMSSVNITFVSVINTFLFAAVSSVYVIKRGNIWGACGFHFAWKFLQAIVFGFNFDGTIISSSVFNISFVKGFDNVTGGTLGVEGGLLVTLALFLLFGALIKSKQNESEIAIIENETQDNEEENEKDE